jgi:hypothetical protein
MTPDRPKTDMYLLAVEHAVAAPGRWIDIPRRFDREVVASVMGGCLRRGYLRVPPQDGDPAIEIDGETYLKTAAPVSARVDEAGGGWTLSICFEGE